MRTHNQNSPKKPEVARFESKMIRAALANVAGAIKGKPEPDDFWYDLTRENAELRNVHLDAHVLRCRQALDEARRQGVGIQAATVRRVEVFFATLCAITVHGFEVSPSTDLGTALMEAAKENSDVTLAAARALQNPCESALELLRIEAHEAIEHDEQVIDLASARLADRCRDRQLAGAR